MNALTDFTSLLLSNPIWSLLPDIVLLCLLAAALVVDLLFQEKKAPSAVEGVTLIGMVLVFTVQLIVFLSTLHIGKPLFAYGTMVINDGLSNFAKLTMYVLSFLGLVYAKQYLKQQGIFISEYYLLVLFALLGMNVMVSSENYILLFIGLELLSLALYAFIAIKGNCVIATEAALKYFVLGSLASGILLFGISMIYGASSSVDLFTVAERSMSMETGRRVLLLLGVVFVVVGICFKFGAAPFHMWVPDVYAGAPTSVTLIISTAPKIAVVIFAYRILWQSLGIHFIHWSLMLQLIAVISLLMGNIAAVLQTNVKRMLGYSTVAHMGFVILGLAANQEAAGSGISSSGFISAFFYALTYGAMSAVAFGVLVAVSKKGKEVNTLQDLAGLNRLHPLLAFLMLLTLFSMAGIPPLLGFYAKFYVIYTMVSLGWIEISIFAVVMSLIGAFYYLRVVKAMYFDVPISDEEAEKVDFTNIGKVLLTINALVLLVLGIFPTPLVRLCQYVFQVS